MRTHQEAQKRIARSAFDVCVIGGGASGAGCALDAQLRGLRTVLLEANDFASGTSSTSTKLIHGGVRYLEQAVKEFDLAEYHVVRRALHERVRMLHNGAYLSRQMEFIVPCFDWRTRLYMGIGLKLYDWVAGEAGLFRSRFLDTRTTLAHLPLLKRDNLVGSVVYADGQFDDGRYNLALVQSAVEAGGEALNYARVIDFDKDPQNRLCAVQVENQRTGERFPVLARAFVNATGPWADTIRKLANPALIPRMRLSKGVHIFISLDVHQTKSALLIPKTEDGRVLFAVPWFDRLLVGTTETEASLTDEMCVLEQEVDYVLRHLNAYLAVPITREQIVSGTAGMRPLVSASATQAASRLARDHEVELDEDTGLVSIMGGKWTTYRAMAEDTIDAVQKRLGQSITPSKTNDYPLVGSQGFTPEFANHLAKTHGISSSTAQHLAVKFGSRAGKVLDLARSEPSLARPITPGETPICAEIIYAAREEMANTIEDVLSRRTGLQLLSWRAAREAAPLTGSLLAAELGWTPDHTQQAVEAYESKITRLLEMAGLPDKLAGRTYPRQPASAECQQ